MGSFPIESLNWSRPIRETVKHNGLLDYEVDEESPSKLVITFLDTENKERVYWIFKVTDIKMEREKI